MDRTIYGIPDKLCGTCGKHLVPTPQWAYKLKDGKYYKWYCSYTCYKKAGGDGGMQRRS